MTRRSRGREVALQVLYLMEQNPQVGSTEVEVFLAKRIRDPAILEFAAQLVAGVRTHQEALDQLIAGYAENWRLDRMAAIDRNILRIGAYEMLHSPDVPAKVAINEALELAKRYSTAQSSRFVNGILDRLLNAEPPAAVGGPAEPAAEPASGAEQAGASGAVDEPGDGV
jgi:N utilization substance protein B